MTPTSPAVDLVDLESAWTPELEAERLALCSRLLEYSSDSRCAWFHERLAGSLVDAEAALTILGDIANSLPALISELTELRASRSMMEEKDARIDALEDQLGSLITYGRWQCSGESLSHHPTLPSAVAAAQDVLGRPANMPRRAQPALTAIKEKTT